MTQPVLNLYDLVPSKRRRYRELADGTVEVYMPRYGEGRVGRILAWMLSDRPVRIHLDEIGARVWHLCDGSRNVHEIGRSLHAELGERIEPVYDRLETFIKQMKKAGLIDFTQ